MASPRRRKGTPLPELASRLFRGKKRATGSLPALPDPSPPGIGLALGSGGARGLGIIPVLEAFDDLGVRPAVIAGTSIGAILGAAYAAGFSGSDLRSHVLRVFRNRRQVTTFLLEARVGRFVDFFGGLGNPVMIDGERLLARFWPAGMPLEFDELAIPFIAVAANLLARDEARLSSGPLISAVAASMAIPGLVRPVERAGLVLIDGFVVNPVPVDAVARRADKVIAVDVSGGDQPHLVRTTGLPNAYQALYQAASIMEQRLMRAKFAMSPPTMHLAPHVGSFGALDFMKAATILRAAEPIRDETKRAIHALLEGG